MKKDLFTVQPFEGIDDYENHPSVAEIELQMILEPNNPVAQALGWDCWFLTNQAGIDWIKEKLPNFPFEFGLATFEEIEHYETVIYSTELIEKTKAWSMSGSDWEWLESQTNQSEVIRKAIAQYRQTQ